MAGSVGIPLNDASGTGVLAGAKLKGHRRTKTPSGATGSSRGSDHRDCVQAGRHGRDPELVVDDPAHHSQPGRKPRPGEHHDVPAAGDHRAHPLRPANQHDGDDGSRGDHGDDGDHDHPARPGAGRKAGPGEVTSTEPAGDTFIDGTKTAVSEPRADIVKTSAVYQTRIIALTMQVQQPVDPRTDERWAGDSTFGLWSLDTNGDGTADFDIQYYVLDGQLGGVVSRPNSTDVLCDIEGAYGPDGYSAFADPGCLGNPASFAYRVAMYYDTDPKDDNADVAADVSPNGGMSFPVTRPS